MHPDKEQQKKELKEAYLETLQEKAVVTGFLGGEFLFEQLNFFERFIIKQIAKENNTAHQINWEAIDKFVGKLK
jgi:menaquinone-dependent protoporphyrinogen oxidase